MVVVVVPPLYGPYWDLALAHLACERAGIGLTACGARVSVAHVFATRATVEAAVFDSRAFDTQ